MIQISAKDLQRKVASVHSKRHQLYDMVFDRCVKGKLQFAAKHGLPFCIANIQAYMPGFPAFDPMSCTMHIREALMRKGFHVQVMPPNHLLISWLTTQSQSNKRVAALASASHYDAVMDNDTSPYDFNAFKKPNGKNVMFI